MYIVFAFSTFLLNCTIYIKKKLIEFKKAKSELYERAFPLIFSAHNCIWSYGYDHYKQFALQENIFHVSIRGEKGKSSITFSKTPTSVSITVTVQKHREHVFDLFYNITQEMFSVSIFLYRLIYKFLLHKHNSYYISLLFKHEFHPTKYSLASYPVFKLN